MKFFYKYILVFVLLLITVSLFVACDDKEIVDNDNNDNCLNNIQGLAFYLLDNDTYGVKIGNATELSNITIPEKYCGKPITLIMESGFEPIQQQGVDYYYKVTKLIISSNVEKIDKRAFYLCGNLTTVEFSPNSKLTHIEDYAFRCCYKLKNIELPSSLTYIGKRAFSNTSINHITIPNNVKTIGEYAFCSDSKFNMCAGILCKSSQKLTGWDDNWDIIYYYFYKPEDKLKGVPYFYRTDKEIATELDFDGHFWKYENQKENIVAIWGVSDNNTWIVKHKYQIKDGERYTIFN